MSSSGATGSSDDTGSSTGSMPGCAATADFVFGQACYTAFELSERLWKPERSVAVHMRSADSAELLIGHGVGGKEFFVLELNDGTLDEIREFSPPGLAQWPPIPVDLDLDGTDELVFGIFPVSPVADAAVLDYDPATGEYAFEYVEELWPDGVTYWASGGLNADADPATEVIGVIVHDLETADVAILDQDGLGWVDVGERVPLSEPDDTFELQSISAGAQPGMFAFRVGRVGTFDDSISIVRSSPNLALEFDPILRPGYTIDFPFGAADVDADGDNDLVLSARPELGVDSCLVYRYEDEGWTGPEVLNLRCGGTSVGDVTGDGAAEILTPGNPVEAYELSTMSRFPLVDAAWPLGLVDANGDGVSEIVFQPPSGEASSRPTVLHVLVSDLE